jgi:hypothetical protein
MAIGIKLKTSAHITGKISMLIYKQWNVFEAKKTLLGKQRTGCSHFQSKPLMTAMAQVMPKKAVLLHVDLIQYLLIHDNHLVMLQ